MNYKLIGNDNQQPTTNNRKPLTKNPFDFMTL